MALQSQAEPTGALGRASQESDDLEQISEASELGHPHL